MSDTVDASLFRILFRRILFRIHPFLENIVILSVSDSIRVVYFVLVLISTTTMALVLYPTVARTATLDYDNQFQQQHQQENEQHHDNKMNVFFRFMDGKVRRFESSSIPSFIDSFLQVDPVGDLVGDSAVLAIQVLFLSHTPHATLSTCPHMLIIDTLSLARPNCQHLFCQTGVARSPNQVHHH